MSPARYSPLCGSRSNPFFFVSAINSASFIVAANALRRICSRPGARSGGATKGRPMPWPAYRNSIACRSSALRAKIGMRLRAALKQDRDLLVRDPIGMADAHAVEALAETVDLAALHREEDLRRRAEAADDLEPHAQQLAQH